MKEALEYLMAVASTESLASTGSRSALLSVPAGRKIVSLEEHQDAPNRIKAAIVLTSSASFCDYVNRFKSLESSIYIDVDGGLFKAVLDHFSLGDPSWCQHTASFSPKKSREFESWMKAHDVWQGQLPFAMMIEELLDTITTPEPADVLKAALEFEANESLAIVSAQNLDDGTSRFVFKKDNASKTVVFPHRIALFMPIHANEGNQLFDARIRYRVSGEGALNFKFSFVKDPETIVREALILLATYTKANTSGLAHYEGRFVKEKS